MKKKAELQGRIAAAKRSAARKRVDVRALLAAAGDARDRSIAPFSRFKVGAALKGKDGRIWTGCNIENASFSLTLCAERVAVFKALSEGVREFDQIAVVTDAGSLTSPCGACRQVLWEFAPDVEVVMANVRGRFRRLSLSDLLPVPFDSSDLG